VVNQDLTGKQGGDYKIGKKKAGNAWGATQLEMRPEHFNRLNISHQNSWGRWFVKKNSPSDFEKRQRNTKRYELNGDGRS